ncbi:MAG: sugar ABC transporter ATP-binding protein [Christensenella sp.]|nr:sugar ABC transporter ATP-binding protein [Christensenella sp.]MEA5001927.1 sugar ABC transporter ATP-binding protein [Christensenella sp.]
MEKCIMKLENITKSFFGNQVLKNVDFDVYAGKVHALVGGNGAGKSTLMKILTGVYARDSGSMTFCGEEVDFKSYKDAFGHGIAMIFQEMSSVLTLSVTENIFLNNEILKHKCILNKEQMRKRALELLALLGVDIDPDVTLGKLTVGERQMVEIVKALSGDARILVMDEPTASLSTKEVENLFGIIENLKQQGIGIIYISHRMNEIMSIADSVTILRDGQIVAELNSGELSIEKMITHMMGEENSTSFEWHPPKNAAFDETILEVDGLQVDGWIKDISFQLHKGEVIGFAGLLSSGRTEILEALFGIRRTQEGKITVLGEERPVKSVKDAIRAGFGLVPEDRRTKGLVLMHSVKDNLTLPVLEKMKKGPFLDQKKMEQATRYSIDELAVKADSIDQMIRLLSGGNQQKIVVSKWLRSDMKIMLLDEPTAGVDISSKKELIATIRKFTNEGNGAIFVSSELQELMAVCDRIYILKKGRIINELRHEEIESEEVLQNAVQQ